MRCSSPLAGSRPSASPARCGRRRRRSRSSTAAPPTSRPDSSTRTSIRTSAGDFPIRGCARRTRMREQWQGRTGDEHYAIEYAWTEAPVRLFWIELRHLLAGTTTLSGSGTRGRASQERELAGRSRLRLPRRHADVSLRHRLRDLLGPYLSLRRTGVRRSRVEPDAFRRKLPTRRTSRSERTVRRLSKAGSIWTTSRPTRAGVTRSSTASGLTPSSHRTRWGASPSRSSGSRTWPCTARSWTCRDAFQAGARIAIGSDWSYSGSYNLRQALGCAESVDGGQWGDRLPARDVWEMATGHGAYALGIEVQTGCAGAGDRRGSHGRR